MLPLKNYSIKRDDEYYKFCIKCTADAKVVRDRNRCPHKKQRNYCRECNGSAFCVHDRRRAQCSDCDGASVCEHKRIRNQCKDCGGVSICEHDRLRSVCKECGGATICSHNNVRSACVECEGTSTCIHKTQKITCKYCNIAGCIKRNVKARMRDVLGHADLDYLGCTIEELMDHLESQFDETMSWDNYGEAWTMDHILQVGIKELTVDQIIERLCYLNIQPLSPYENSKKNLQKL